MLLHEAVSVLAAQPGLCEREQDSLTVYQAFCTLQIGLHPFGIDHQLLDNLLCAGEREIERDGRFRARPRKGDCREAGGLSRTDASQSGAYKRLGTQSASLARARTGRAEP